MLASYLLVPLTAAAQAGTVSVPPQVHLGPRADGRSDSVSLVWQSPDVDSGFTVRYSQGGPAKTASVGHKTIRVEGIDPHRVYSAALTGLRLGVPIAYKLLSGNTVKFASTVMAPKSDRQPYHFAVFGDCGVAGVEQAQVAYQTYKVKPDMVVLTGDLVYGDGRIVQYRKNFFPYYTSELASPKDGAPLFATSLTVASAGNHDIAHRDFTDASDLLAYFYYWDQPLNGPLHTVGAKNTPIMSGPEDRQKAFLASAGAAYPAMSNFSYDYGNAHWTVLDSNSYVDWSNPDLRQWLAADLAKAANKAWRFVVFHHPGFHSSKKHENEKQMRWVADLFEKAKVDVVFNGHVHNYQRSKPIQVGPKLGAAKEELYKNDWPTDGEFDGVKNTRPKGVVYIVTGAGGQHLYDPDLNGHPELWKSFQQTYHAVFSFSDVAIDGNTFTMRQVDKDGREIDRLTIKK